MIVLLNPNAGGGNALRKWKRLEPEVRRRWGRLEVICTAASHQLEGFVSRFADGGEAEFVAAGGDGTINALLQAVMIAIREGARASIAIGAIGLGSSNDFHKPMATERNILGIPCALDFASAAWRDVGMVRFRRDGGEGRRYFLVNASAGITAEANRIFNAPDRILRGLKQRWTSAAVLYAAARAMMACAAIPAALCIDGGPGRSVRLENLAVLKSPHVSGGLRYPVGAPYDSGSFIITLVQGAGRLGRPGVFRGLMRGRLPATLRIESRTASSVALKAQAPFPIECDGEVLLTTEATFSLLPRQLRVCPC